MRLKKFNEMLDPMGTWNPKHPDNQFVKKETKDDFKDQEYIKTLPKDTNKLIDALDAGLDPSTMMQLLLRVCFRDNLTESFNILINRIKDNVTYGNTTGKDAKLNLCKRAVEYGRVEFLKKFEKLGWFKDFNENDWNDLLDWLKLSRQMKNRPDDKERTSHYLQVLKYNPNDFYHPNK